MEYLYCSKKKIDEMCYELAKKIKESGFKQEVILGICRGGWIPARYIADLLGDFKEIANIKTEFYTGIEKTKKELKITQDISVNVEGKKVLLVDDVADSGRTLKGVIEHLKKKGAVEVKVACLHTKPQSIYEPDFYVDKTDAWIIYPWMEKETVDLLKNNPEELKRTGIPEEKIKKLLEL